MSRYTVYFIWDDMFDNELSFEKKREAQDFALGLAYDGHRCDRVWDNRTQNYVPWKVQDRVNTLMDEAGEVFHLFQKAGLGRTIASIHSLWYRALKPGKTVKYRDFILMYREYEDLSKLTGTPL